jgi:hypothetical protein
MNHQIVLKVVGLEILTALVMNGSIFWNIMPRYPLEVYRRFGGPVYLHICNMLHAVFLLSLFFDPEVGGDIFLRNFGSLSTEYMALLHRR